LITVVKNVLPYNEKCNEKYWSEKHRIPGGHFGWVEKDLINLGFFKNIRNAKIGVPQGGAISGLIANLVLDYADSEILKLKSSKLLYVRFCDDMVIMHPSVYSFYYTFCVVSIFIQNRLCFGQ